jgi:O-antigen ligase
MEESIVIDSFGSITKLIGVSAAGFWMVMVFVSEKFRKPHPFHVALILFVLWNMLSFLWSVDPDRTIDRIITYVQLIILVYLLWDLYTTPESVTTGLQVYILGTWISIGSVISNYVAGNLAYASSVERYTAAGFNANHFGLILVLGLPVAWYLAVSSKDEGRIGRLLKLANFAYIPAAIFTIFLSGSRSSLIVAFPALLFILWSIGRLKLIQRILILIVVVSALAVLQSYIPETTIERLASSSDELTSGDLNGRMEIWRQGLVVFEQHPLIGVGSSAFRSAIELRGTAPHNVYLSILVDVGIAGLLLFGFILIIVTAGALNQPKWEAQFWLSILLIWAVGVSVRNWEDTKATWLFFSFIIISAALHVHRFESEQPVAFPQPKSAMASR